jgi:hypothetical protein
MGGRGSDPIIAGTRGRRVALREDTGDPAEAQVWRQ